MRRHEHRDGSGSVDMGGVADVDGDVIGERHRPLPPTAAYPAALGGWAGGTGGTFAGVPHGIYGYSGALGGSGVVGSSSTAPGVLGLTAGESSGVVGQSLGGGVGVKGEIPAGQTANAIAIYGLNYSSYTGPGPGAGGFGIYGLSANGHGLVGATAAAGGRPSSFPS
jgi:hypothetical protein